MAEKEVRVRTADAADKVKSLLESGWQPEAGYSIRAAFSAMFSDFRDWQKDPSSDLYAAVEKAFDAVGRHDPEQAIVNARRLGEVQVQAFNAAASGLDVFGARYVRVEPPATQRPAATFENQEPSTPWAYDVFISHASADKEPFVTELANALREEGVRVWYDAFTLKVGDGLRQSIDNGLKSSRFGIVVLSHAFFRKEWPQEELSALFGRQVGERVKVILPVWHGVTSDEVRAYAPMIADKMAANSSDGLEVVVAELVEAIRSE